MFGRLEISFIKIIRLRLLGTQVDVSYTLNLRITLFREERIELTQNLILVFVFPFHFLSNL